MGSRAAHSRSFPLKRLPFGADKPLQRPGQRHRLALVIQHAQNELAATLGGGEQGVALADAPARRYSAFAEAGDGGQRQNIARCEYGIAQHGAFQIHAKTGRLGGQQRTTLTPRHNQLMSMSGTRKGLRAQLSMVSAMSRPKHSMARPDTAARNAGA